MLLNIFSARSLPSSTGCILSISPGVIWPPRAFYHKCLIAEFQRLDEKENAQRKGGILGAEYGKRGGRPKKTK
jgi:hypothetical protein